MEVNNKSGMSVLRESESVRGVRVPCLQFPEPSS